MDEMFQTYRVYILTDDRGVILQITSDAFLQETDGWILVDEGDGDRYHHAQGNYLQHPARDSRGVCRYRWDGVKIVERTAEEMDADAEMLTPPDPENAGMEQRMKQVEEALDMLLSGVTEDE